MKHKTRCKSTW